MMSATETAQSATQMSSGRSFSSISDGLPPPSFWCTR